MKSLTCSIFVILFCVSESRVFVALTFDDGLTEHLAASKLLSNYNLHGSFYLNSGNMGSSGRITWDDAKEMANSGHEIGGHTITHANLGNIDDIERRIEICNDRVTITNAMGFAPKSFVYPFGVQFDGVQQLLSECGYSFARDSGGLETPLSCFGCPTANQLPLQEPFDIRSISYRNFMGAQFFIDQVIAAEEDFQEKDGILPFIFHEIRETDPPIQGIRRDDLETFVSWLSNNTNVTVDTLINIAERSLTTVITTTQVTEEPTNNTDNTNNSNENSEQNGTFTDFTTPPTSNEDLISENNRLRDATILLGVFLGISLLILLLVFLYRMQELHCGGLRSKKEPNIPRAFSDDSIESQYEKYSKTIPLQEVVVEDKVEDVEEQSEKSEEVVLEVMYSEDDVDTQFSASSHPVYCEFSETSENFTSVHSVRDQNNDSVVMQ